MKNVKLKLFAQVLSTFFIAAFTLGTLLVNAQDTKSTRRIKMVKVVDGKKFELDTIVSGNEMFIWQGDTVNGKELKNRISPSGFDKKHRMEVKVDTKDGKKNVMVYKFNDGEKSEPLIWHSESGDNVFHFKNEKGDSIKERIIIRKKHVGSDDDVLFINKGSKMMSGSVPKLMMLKHKDSGQAINLNDPNVISFKKKDLSGGREKIEIIRKKSDKKAEMNFEFDQFDHFISPAAKSNFEFINESGDVKKEIRIIKKDVDNKYEKIEKTEEIIKTEENK